MATEPGGHGVEHLLVHEPAAAANGYAHFLEAARKDPGQRAQQLALGIDLWPAPGVGPRKLLGEEAAVGRRALEVPRSSQSQGRFQRFLQMPVRALDGSVLMGGAAVVPRRFHSVLRAQSPIARGQILLRIRLEIAERRRQAVRAVLCRDPTEFPQRMLQSLRQRLETLPAKNRLYIGEARPRHPEVIQQVVQGLAGDRDPQRGRHGEVRYPLPAGNLLLLEENLLIRTVAQLPGPHTPLQRPAHARVQIRVVRLKLVEQIDRTQLRIRHQQRYQLLLEHLRQRIRPPSAPARTVQRRHPAGTRDPISRRTAEPRSRGGDLDTTPVLHAHEKLPLLNCKVTAGHGSRSLFHKEMRSCPLSRKHQLGSAKKTS